MTNQIIDVNVLHNMTEINEGEIPVEEELSYEEASRRMRGAHQHAKIKQGNANYRRRILPPLIVSGLIALLSGLADKRD